MINTIKSGRVDMISHPGNPAFPIDIQAVVKAAAGIEWRWRSTTPRSATPMQAAKATAAPSSRRRATSAPTSPSAPTPVAFSLGDFDHCHRLVTEADFPEERILARSPVPCSIFSRAAVVPIFRSSPTSDGFP